MAQNDDLKYVSTLEGDSRVVPALPPERLAKYRALLSQVGVSRLERFDDELQFELGAGGAALHSTHQGLLFIGKGAPPSKSDLYKRCMDAQAIEGSWYGYHHYGCSGSELRRRQAGGGGAQ